MASIISAGTTSGTALNMAGDTSGVLELATNGSTTAITIDTSQRAAFVAGTALLPAITTTGDTNTGIWFPAADTIAFAEGGTESMRIDSSGNVGIGTTNPSPKITVARTATTSVTNASYYLGLGGTENLLDSKRLIGMGYSSGSTDEYPTAMGYVETNNGGFTNGAIAFYTRSVTTNTAPSERMRISSSGDFTLNNPAPSTTTFGTIYTAGDANCFWGNFVNSTVTKNQFTFNNPNGEVGRVTTNGSATTYNTSSDYRLKENVVPMTGALNTISKLNPVYWTWKVDGTNGQGFIAHELQAIVPDCVTGEKDAVDEKGKPIYQGVDTSFLVATLTAAIQEQQTIINDLTARITALEGAA